MRLCSTRPSLALFLLTTIAGGCIPQSTETTATPTAMREAPAAVQITIDNFTYAPASLTVAPGTTVTWVNHDDVPHTVTSTSKPRLLDSPPLDTDDKFSFLFEKTGSYDYFCAVHPKMTGRIIVK